jgi:alpha-tubulin suppressor-like RCC1 family protein
MPGPPVAERSKRAGAKVEMRSPARCRFEPFGARGDMELTRIGSAVVVTAQSLALAACGGSGSGGRPDPATRQPVLVSASLRFSSIEGSQAHTCGSDLEGRSWCWGKDAYGELGTSEPLGLCDIPGIELVACTATPRLVAGAPVFADYAMAVGAGRSCGLTPDGAAWCWGFGLGGQLGDGSASNSVAPREVAGGHRFAQLKSATSGLAACGLTPAGAGWCWGPNGQWSTFGNGGTDGAATPVAVDWGRPFVAFDLGELHGCGLDASGHAWCWGSNWYGQLGVGSAGGSGGTASSPTPVAVTGDGVFRQIAAGADHTCALDDAGAAWCWGAAYAVGSATTVRDYVGTPGRVDGGHVYSALASGAQHTCGLTGDGEIWCWGQNYLGELGDGTQAAAQVPVRVRSDVRFARLAQRATCALDTDGRAWCWGDNSDGQVGRRSVYER